ncbi:MAG: DPP IV N-terminal domain-containing protein [Gemmatimonadaceae bacterium]
MRRLTSLIVFLAVPLSLSAQDRLTVPRIFGTREFDEVPVSPLRWMRDGRSLLDIRYDSAGGTQLVRVDVVTGATTVLADATMLTTSAGVRLHVEEAALSQDENRVLLFHSSVRLWRSNTRGRYHVLDLLTKRLTPLAGVEPTPTSGGAGSSSLTTPAADSSLEMFATFSPTGTHVAFVREHNLWVKDLTTGALSQLTTDGSADIINGTADWAYEEELGLRDAFRWSPDGRRLAYWRFDQGSVGQYPLVDELTIPPTVHTIRYPTAGEANARVRVGVVSVTGGPTQWLATGPDTGFYLPRAAWVDNDSIAVTRYPRRQDRAELLMLSATSGDGRTVEIDRDSAYVGSGFAGVEGDGMTWLRSGDAFLWASDRTGWRQVFLMSRAGAVIRQVTTDGADVLDVLAVDEARDMLYVTMAAPTPTQRQVFRFSIHGGKKAQVGGVRMFSAPGTHHLQVGPTGQWAVDVHSTLDAPSDVTLYEFPLMRRSRVMEDNAALGARLATLHLHSPEFLKIPLPNGNGLDAYRVVPPDFDPSKKYPVLMYAYGGPAAPQATDAWHGERYVWHQMLAQYGYVVVVVDNRGAAWRGRDFRKVTEGQLGVAESDDQISAARWLATQSWVDGTRIGLWGWSYGGFLATMSLMRGGNVFKMGMAVAPVTDWRFYDSIYTERYMRTPSENTDGYRRSSPLPLVSGLSARFLLVHGTGDDNVHPQNTLQLAERLIDAGKTFQMMLYPNRAHDMVGGNATVHLFETLTAFVLANL